MYFTKKVKSDLNVISPGQECSGAHGGQHERDSPGGPTTWVYFVELVAYSYPRMYLLVYPTLFTFLNPIKVYCISIQYIFKSYLWKNQGKTGGKFCYLSGRSS